MNASRLFTECPDLNKKLDECVNCIYELNSKRGILEENQTKLSENLLEIHDLQRLLDKEKREKKDINIQLEAAIKAARKGDEERASTRESLSWLTVQSEALKKERDSLHDQTRTLQLENVELKRKLEKAEIELNKMNSLQETFHFFQTQERMALEAVTAQQRSLEQEYTKLERLSSAAMKVSAKANTKLNYQKMVLQESMKENKNLQSQVLHLTAELEKCQNQLKLVQTNEEGPKIFQEEWEKALQDFTLRLSLKEEELNKLQTCLTNTLGENEQLQQSELNLKKIARELEEEIENKSGKARSDKGTQTWIEECPTVSESVVENDFATSSAPDI